MVKLKRTSQRREGFGTGAGGDEFDIFMAVEFGHSKQFGSVVLDKH
jgi:hypothetical protein